MIRTLFRYLGPLCLLSSATLLAQTFKNPLIIPAGTNPLAVAMADVNADGHPDLLYVEANVNGGALHVLTGSGTGTFQRAQDIPLPAGVCYGVCYITVGDINGDGVSDIVLNVSPIGSNASGGAVAALLGNGDGTFQAPIVSTFTTAAYTLTSPGKIGIGDLNGDGAADLAVPDPTNGKIYILLGDNTGHFHAGTYVTDQSYPVKVILRDINGDGHLDLITLPAISGTAFVAFGNGDGTFATGTSYSSGQVPPIYYDVDGDGIPDLVFSNYDSTNSVYDLVFEKGSEDGTFATAVALTTILPQQLLDIGNYTDSGRADLLITMPSGFGVYPRNSDGTYASSVVQTVSSTINRSSVGAVGDVNGDGHPDIAVAIFGGIAVFLGNGDGSFQSADVYDVGHLVNSAALVKFTGSSNVDIAVQQPATFPRLLMGDGTGKFTLAADPNSSYGTTPAVGSLLAGDFNGDGNTDLFETGFQSTSPAVLYGQSPGSFTNPASVGSAQLVADVNNDGRTDLLLANSSGISVQLGQANNSFLTQTMPPRVSTFAAAVAVGDLNGDGKPDLIVSTQSGLDVYLGNGDGTFTFSNQILQTTLNITGYPSYTGAAIADINGDGKPDLVYVGTFQQSVSSTMPHLVVLPGDGDGTFGTPMVFTLQNAYTNLQVADVNKDGKPDLILSNQSALAVLMNAGNGAFGAEEPYVAGTFVGTPVVGDVNGDGYPDIVVPNSGTAGTTVTVLLNKGAAATSKLLAATLTLSPEPSAYDQPFTATLISTAQPQPTGNVSFFSDDQFLGTAAFSAGSAAFTYTGTLLGGGHVITAAYSGDSNYSPASFTDLHTAGNQTFSTSTTLTATPSSLLATQTVRLVAQVNPATGGPAANGGYVTFMDGSVALGAAVTNSTGSAFLDTSILSVGTHNIVANFLGMQVSAYPQTLVLSPSSSASAPVTISAVPTTTTLTSSSTSTSAGTVLTFTAIVAATTGTPFGGVTFFDGTQSLGTMAMSGDQAVFSTASLATGSHSITAVFNANNTFASSTSPASPVTLQSARRGVTPTLTIVQTQPVSDGTTQLTATVSPGSAGGNVTFLADGAILGSVPVNAEGIAQISGFAASGGIHSITASVTPTAGYAPSASPTSTDGWLASTPSFALSVDSQSIQVDPGKPGVINVTVAALAQMVGSVTFSCAIPDSEYTCTIGSQQLAYGASTTITVTSQPQLRIAGYGAGACVGCLVVFLLVLPLARHRKLTLLLLVVLFASTTLVGCSIASRFATASPAVLRVQATSGAGSTTVRSIEIFVNPQESDQPLAVR